MKFPSFMDCEGKHALKFRSIAAVFGGFLLQFTMGAFYSFGNMAPYMTSYMRQYSPSSRNITSTDFVVVQSAWGMTQGVVMPLSGFLINAIGEKRSMVLGSIIFSSGCALTYFTINKELWMVAATYGFVSAFGQNIALIPTLTTGMKWFPNSKGTVMGFVVGGFGGGAFVFNQIQTQILNPDNIDVSRTGEDKGFFTDPDLLERVPDLLLKLAAIYFALGMTACLLITQPPEGWLASATQKKNEEKDGQVVTTEKKEEAQPVTSVNDYVTPCEALMRKEFYLLWFTRLSVVMVTQVIAAYYKTFGQTFIKDDQFLAIVGAVTSIFNCTGRLLYGFIMDKTAYKVAMSIEASLLVLLMSTFYLTSMIGVDPRCFDGTILLLENATTSADNYTLISDLDASVIVDPCATSWSTKIAFAVWVWAIFFTFPGTYSTQPAVTTQTFGHKYGGFIYAFLFSSDLVNNLLVATLSKAIQEQYGWLGVFLAVSGFGVLALIITLMYPYKPGPGPRPAEGRCMFPFLEVLGLVEIPRDEDDIPTRESEHKTTKM